MCKFNLLVTANLQNLHVGLIIDYKLAVNNCVCNTTKIIYKLTYICGDEYVEEISKEAQIQANQHLKVLMDKKPEL